MDRVVGEMNANRRWSTCNNGKGFGARDNVRQTLIDTDEGMGADPPLSASDVCTLSVEDVPRLRQGAFHVALDFSVFKRY